MHAVDWLVGLHELSPELAERWVAAALAEAAALRGHDAQLFPSTEDQAARAACEGLRDTWRRWADDAETLLRRLSFAKRLQVVPGVEQLDYEIGRARAMLKLTPAMIDAARRQDDGGETFAAAEVRRELRLPPRR